MRQRSASAHISSGDSLFVRVRAAVALIFVAVVVGAALATMVALGAGLAAVALRKAVG